MSIMALWDSILPSFSLVVCFTSHHFAWIYSAPGLNTTHSSFLHTIANFGESTRFTVRLNNSIQCHLNVMYCLLLACFTDCFFYMGFFSFSYTSDIHSLDPTLAFCLPRNTLLLFVLFYSILSTSINHEVRRVSWTWLALNFLSCRLSS